VLDYYFDAISNPSEEINFEGSEGTTLSDNMPLMNKEEQIN
jgi:hypothetical protein